MRIAGLDQHGSTLGAGDGRLQPSTGRDMILKRTVLKRRMEAYGPLAVAGALLLYGLWPWLPLPNRPAPPETIVFFGFSILGEVMYKAVFPAFQKEWQDRTGRRVEFISSFSGSGTVRNQLIMGVPADLAL